MLKKMATKRWKKDWMTNKLMSHVEFLNHHPHTSSVEDVSKVGQKACLYEGVIWPWAAFHS